MNYFLKYTFIIIIAILSNSLVGQPNYRSGYIITMDNDTIFGKIKDRGGIRNSDFCLFKTDRKAKKYYPNEIKSYRFIGDKYYKSQKLFYKTEYKYVFTDVLLEGKVNLYYYWKNRSMAYYIEKEDGNLVGLLNKTIFVKSNDLQYKENLYYSFEVYQDTLYSLFRDCRKIQNQVDNVNYNHKALINITKAYINETCKEKSCINYERNLKSRKPSFGVFSGIQISKIAFWEKTVALGNSSTNKPKINSDIHFSFPVGIFYNIPMPVVNDRLSFQIELISNNSKYKRGSIELNNNSDIEIESWTMSIPLLIKYRFYFKKISPSFSFGKETGFVVNSNVDMNENTLYMIHKTQKGSWFCELGINYKLNSGLSLFSNIRVLQYQNLIIESESNISRSSYSQILNYFLFSHRYKTNIATLYLGINF